MTISISLSQGQWRGIQEFWEDCGRPGGDGGGGGDCSEGPAPTDAPAELEAVSPDTPDSVLRDGAAAFGSACTSEADGAGKVVAYKTCLPEAVSAFARVAAAACCLYRTED